jgi:hypothetical protein
MKFNEICNGFFFEKCFADEEMLEETRKEKVLSKIFLKKWNLNKLK